MTASPAMSAPRLQLARVAAAAATGVHGVTGTEQTEDPARVTAHGGERVPGVACVAAGEGGYDVTLFVCVRLVALAPLADRLHGAVRDAVRVDGLEPQLRELHVVVCDVVGTQDRA